MAIKNKLNYEVLSQALSLLENDNTILPGLYDKKDVKEEIYKIKDLNSSNYYIIKNGEKKRSNYRFFPDITISDIKTILIRSIKLESSDYWIPIVSKCHNKIKGEINLKLSDVATVSKPQIKIINLIDKLLTVLVDKSSMKPERKKVMKDRIEIDFNVLKENYV
tara:strand:- start:2438 stop:2929 length:492 start_codon:yes stop_codon:yes gene_type:complete